MERKGPLHPDTERGLADREGLANATSLALDHDTLEYLGAAAASFDYLEVNAHAVACAESRALLDLFLLELVDYRAHGLGWFVEGL